MIDSEMGARKLILMAIYDDFLTENPEYEILIET